MAIWNMAGAWQEFADQICFADRWLDGLDTRRPGIGRKKRMLLISVTDIFLYDSA